MNEQPTEEKPDLPTEAEFKRLVAQANDGDAGAIKKLREQLDTHPEIWQRVGDLAAHAEMLMIDLISAGSKLMAESLHRTLQQMKAELIGPETSMLEKMAVDRMLACWLQVQYIDTVVAKSTGGTLPNANYQLKRQDAANKRYMAAVKSLGELRRLLPRGAGDTGQPAAPLKVFGGDSVPADAATA